MFSAPDESLGGWRDDPREFHLAVELPAVLDPSQCNTLLGYIADFGQARGEIALEDERDPRLDPGIRKVSQTTVPRRSDTRWVYDHVAGALDACNRDHFGFDLRDFNEPLAIVDYRAGDFYQWHLDVGRGATYRKLSFSIVLSPPADYEGGALAFPTIEFDQVDRGSAIVFPSYLLHGVQPVTTGRRVALVGWIGGPRFR